MAEVINGILINEAETKNIMTKSSLPVGGYSVNPYVGCTHACKYCYASFMKRFTGHKEEWGTFLDVKHWPEIKNPKKYAGHPFCPLLFISFQSVLQFLFKRCCFFHIICATEIKSNTCIT